MFDRRAGKVFIELACVRATAGQGSETDNWRTGLRQSVQKNFSGLQEQEPQEVQQKQALSPALGKTVHQYKLETDCSSALQKQYLRILVDPD